jgi:hypothetical protein
LALALVLPGCSLPKAPTPSTATHVGPTIGSARSGPAPLDPGEFGYAWTGWTQDPDGQTLRLEIAVEPAPTVPEVVLTASATNAGGDDIVIGDGEPCSFPGITFGIAAANGTELALGVHPRCAESDAHGPLVLRRGQALRASVTLRTYVELADGEGHALHAGEHHVAAHVAWRDPAGTVGRAARSVPVAWPPSDAAEPFTLALDATGPAGGERVLRATITSHRDVDTPWGADGCGGRVRFYVSTVAGGDATRREIATPAGCNASAVLAPGASVVVERAVPRGMTGDVLGEAATAWSCGAGCSSAISAKRLFVAD